MAKKLSASVLKALSAAGLSPDAPAETPVETADISTGKSKTSVKKTAAKAAAKSSVKSTAKKSVSKKSAAKPVELEPEMDAAEDDAQDTGEALARMAAELMFTKKGYDVVIMDLRGVADVTDFFVICTADSDTQVKAIADAVSGGLKDEGEAPYHSEGFGDLSWVLLDYVNVVAHIFLKEKREFYGLEKLWGDAKMTHITDTPPATKPISASSTSLATTAKPAPKRKAAPRKKAKA